MQKLDFVKIVAFFIIKQGQPNSSKIALGKYQ